MDGGLTRREAEYLKALFNLISEKGSVGSLNIANSLSVSCATASETLKRLSEKGMVVREPWRGVRLTEMGFREVSRIIRNHRIFETYAYRVLSVSIDEACECARRVELYLSDNIVDSMCKILRHPRKCPHNKDIPTGVLCCVGRR
ncbi:MAG: metal-dependent transcriptional regulator [Candidatus Bathyarchaeia archaeon]